MKKSRTAYLKEEYTEQVGNVVVVDYLATGNTGFQEEFRYKGELLEVTSSGLCIETPDQDEVFISFRSIIAYEKAEEADLAYMGQLTKEGFYA